MKVQICQGCGKRRPCNYSDGRVDLGVLSGEYCADCWDEFELEEAKPGRSKPPHDRHRPDLARERKKIRSDPVDDVIRAVEEQDGP